MKDIGKMIYNTDGEQNLGMMAPNTKEIIFMEENKEKGLIHGKMGVNMKVTGKIIEFVVKENIHGLTEDNMKANGIIITCMVKEYTPGKMVEGTKEIT